MNHLGEKTKGRGSAPKGMAVDRIHFFRLTGTESVIHTTMTTTKVKAHDRNVNGTIIQVSAHTRGIGAGYTKDGQRINRAQREFILSLEKRARKPGKLGDAARRRLADINA